MAVCKKCGKKLSADEIALYRKTVKRDADEYLCISCLADFFECDEEVLHKKIEFYKRMGCMLFTP